MRIVGMSMRLLLEKFLRVFLKFRQAVMAAEKISLPVVLVLSRRRSWLHCHTADRIGSDRFMLLQIFRMRLRMRLKKTFGLFLEGF